MLQDVRLLTAASGFLAAALFSAFGGPSLSSAVFAPESRYTDLIGKLCQTEPAAGRGGGAEEEQVKRCPGLGGARVVVLASHSETALGFEWSAKERAEDVVRNWSLGYKLEWRGYMTSRGFEPYATTIRVLFNDQIGLGERPVLAVLRVRPGEACVVGAIDIAANPDGYELARRLADTRTPNFVCGRDSPQTAGTATAHTRDFLARL